MSASKLKWIVGKRNAILISESVPARRPTILADVAQKAMQNILTAPYTRYNKTLPRVQGPRIW